MERRFFLKLLAASIAATNLYKVPQLHAQTVSSLNSVLSLQMNLSGAGRLGFYIDYSERETVGYHTFYVTRTHGSQGAVSVTYATEGDAHTSVSGSISWANGDMSIKSFTVEVTAAHLNTHQNTLGLGEHRIVARLSNPTNSAVLHFGTEETKAYGVIDNDVLASDDNAVFYDSAAVTNGTGAQASPYNSVYDAIANIGSKRYLYGKGTTIVTNADTANVLGNICNALPIPPTRTGEADRIFIRNWSGNTWTVTGTGTISAGFHTEGGESFQTYRGIDFLNLDNSTASNGFGIFYQYGGSTAINVETCTGTSINGRVGSNQQAFGLWGVDGGKIWRCSADNIQNGGDNTNENTAMFFTYDGKNISVQRCEANNVANLVYHKRVKTPFDTTTSVRFCIDNTVFGVHYGRSGSSGIPHSYSIVQCNLFKENGDRGIFHEPGSLGLNGTNNAEKHWWCNNVFYSRAAGEKGSIEFRQAYSAIIFNNIYLNCRKLWRESQDSSSAGSVMEYANHELHFGTTLVSQTYEYQSKDYANSVLLQTVRPDFGTQDVISDPLFIDPANGDFTLQPGSPAITGGVSGTQQGVYLLGVEKIGASDLSNNIPPEKMKAPDVTILDS